MLPVKDLKKILLTHNLLDKEALKKAELKAKKGKVPLEQYLTYGNVVSEDALYEKAAAFYELPFVSLKGKLIPPETLRLIPEEIATKYQLAIFQQSNEALSVATALPPNIQMNEFIKRKEERDIELFFTTPSSVNHVLRQYRKDIEAELRKLDIAGKELDVVEVINGLIENAIKGDASDIHIEPREEKTIIRYRIDGVLREVITLPKELHPGMVTRVKILSNLKVDEHRLPQDGRAKMKGPGYKVSLRISIIPILDGEKVVMRILHQEVRFSTLKELGLQKAPLETIEKRMKKTEGMILAVGPTGSGKTTTLYTLINMVNSPGINISTIEDPIEYSIPTVNQSQVNPQIDFTFANGLRAFLRQDPDVIMVGEIRDEDTAKIALHAALTGHFVLSTLHTNDAATTLPRLLEMGIPAYLIASTVDVVVAQRLVRRVCPYCKEQLPVAPEQKTQVEKELKINMDEILKKYGETQSLTHVYKGKGCKLCHFGGMKGRVGIYEVLENTPEIYETILRGASTKEVSEIAKKQGMMTMLEDGVLKVFQGITTFEEILRVI